MLQAFTVFLVPLIKEGQRFVSLWGELTIKTSFASTLDPVVLDMSESRGVDPTYVLLVPSEFEDP